MLSQISNSILRQYTFVALDWQQFRLRLIRFYHHVLLPLLNNPQDVFLEPLPWRNINPETYARILSVMDHQELIAPKDDAHIFVLGERIQIPASVLYRLGYQQEWFRLGVGYALAEELQKNRKIDHVLVEGREQLQLTSLSPGHRGELVAYAEPEQ